MKHVLIAALLLPLCSVAQIDSLKATAGKFSTELNVNPFQGNLTLNNAIQQIKVRHFLSEQLAIRVGFNATSRKLSNATSSPYGQFPINYENVRKSFTFGLNLGVERHFRGTKRLSPYVGGELTFSNKNSTQKIKSGTTETNIKGGWQTGTQSSFEERGFFRYGLNAVCGFDYFFAKNFFLGYEFLFQFTQTNYKDIDITYKGTTGQPPSPNYDDKESFIGPTLINGIRLGFIF